MTLSLLERAKKIKELNAVRAALTGGTLGLLERAKNIKALNALRVALGAETVSGSAFTKLVLPENPKSADLRRATKQWLQENLQGKTIRTSDGKSVLFNRNESSDHLSFNARRSVLHAKAITHVADVFQTGEFKGREMLHHERKDGFVAFHKYRKWVEIDEYRVLLEVAAGEYADGRLEAVADLLAYNQKIAGKEKVGNAPAGIEAAADSSQAAGFVSYADNHTAVFGKLQGDSDGFADYVQIVQIIDKKGNDIDVSLLDADSREIADDGGEGVSAAETEADNLKTGKRSRSLAAALEAIKAQAQQQRTQPKPQSEQARHGTLPENGGKAMYNFMRGMP